MGNIHVVKEITLTVEKKPLVLVLTYLSLISLQTRTVEVEEVIKNIFNWFKMQTVFEN